MKNQLKKIIHCVLITLILQSQVLSVQAAQVKFDENKKFSVVWRNNVYMITYDPNGGSGSMSSQQFKYDNDAVLAQNTYSRNEQDKQHREDYNKIRKMDIDRSPEINKFKEVELELEA